MGGGGSYFNASPKDAYFSELPLNQSILNLLGHSIAHFIIENNSAFFDQGIVNRIWSEFIIVWHQKYFFFIKWEMNTKCKHLCFHAKKKINSKFEDHNRIIFFVNKNIWKVELTKFVWCPSLQIVPNFLKLVLVTCNVFPYCDSLLFDLKSGVLVTN